MQRRQELRNHRQVHGLDQMSVEACVAASLNVAATAIAAHGDQLHGPVGRVGS